MYVGICVVMYWCGAKKVVCFLGVECVGRLMCACVTICGNPPTCGRINCGRIKGAAEGHYGGGGGG